MLRKIILKNNTTGREVMLPVSPESFQIDRGMDIESLNMHFFGEYNMYGSGMTLFTETLYFMLPARPYPFCNAGTVYNPYYYIDFLERTADAKQICRFVVSDTPTQCDVLLENLKYEEKDGTNDVYCALTIRRFRPLTSGQAARTTTAPATVQQTYTVVYGDTLGNLCQKFYSDRSLAQKLAVYNKIPNKDLILPGQVLQLPEKSQL